MKRVSQRFFDPFRLHHPHEAGSAGVFSLVSGSSSSWSGFRWGFLLSFGFITLMKRVLQSFFAPFRIHHPYEAGSEGISGSVSASSPS
jgi:hypothetical protein